MYTNKKTIANSPYDEALSEFHAAAPSLQAIADSAFALAAGYHRNTIPHLRNHAVTQPNHSLRVQRRPLDLIRRAI